MSRPLQYLLDTDTCIYLLNGNLQIKARVAEVGVEVLAVAILTVGELYFGAYNSGRVEANLDRVRTFFAPPGPAILLVDDAAVRHFGQFKAALRRTGRPIGDIDLLIAGVALTHKLRVVTNNTEHFGRIPEITLENWFNI